MSETDEYYGWHKFKDECGPTFSGSPAWHRYMRFVEQQLKRFGVVDLIRNAWTYPRWFTSDSPEDRNWTLVSGGKPVRVAAYGPYSGSTGPDGVTAELVYYDPANPPKSVQGRIVVFQTCPHPGEPFPPEYRSTLTFTDYEYLFNPETFPPLFTTVPASRAVYFDTPFQFWQLEPMVKVLVDGKAAGGIVVFDMSFDRLAGLYPLTVPPLYHVPTLFLDRVAGQKVIEDARNGKTATLTLLAKVETAKTYQLIGYLPGRDYGTAKDEKILLLTHTDGPSISQEDGALGLLGIVAHNSQIPQKDRPRTLMIFLDNRHFMPGMEEAFARQDWFTRHPEAKKSIVGLIAMEHLGEVEFREEGDAFLPTGQVEPSMLYTRSDPRLIDLAVKAVEEHDWPRVVVKSVEKVGIHGETQGPWLGLGSLALKWDLPAFAVLGGMGAYWETTSRLDRFDKHLFSKQVKTMAQLTAELMGGNWHSAG